MNKLTKTAVVSIAIGFGGLVIYGTFFTCLFHDHSRMKVQPILMDYVDSLELKWHLESGYAGRVFADNRLGQYLKNFTIDCDISAMSHNKSVFQRGERGTPIGDFGYSGAEIPELPVEVGWVDSESIRQLAETDEDISLVAVVRIKGEDGKIVYQGFLRSNTLNEAQQVARLNVANAP